LKGIDAALIRETSYSEPSMSRQVRLHRQLAEVMERPTATVPPSPHLNGGVAQRTLPIADPLLCGI